MATDFKMLHKSSKMSGGGSVSQNPESCAEALRSLTTRCDSTDYVEK